MANRLIVPLRITESTVGQMQRDTLKRNESLEGGALWRAIDFALYLVLIVLVMFSVRSVLVDPVRVDGKSMLDTFSDGDVMLVDRTAYMFRSPERGDIILCYYPDAYYEAQQLPYATRVKRVLAVGGDTIETRDGAVYVNGEPVDEPYISPDRVGAMYIRRQTVPENCYYVLGDNRAVSRDSRYESVGPIPHYRIVGKVRMIVYPFSKLHLI